MGYKDIYAGGSKTKLPSPTLLKADKEIIWSSTTGRTSTGKMVGDVIAEKKTVDITWECLRDADLTVICKTMKAGFFEFWLPDCGELVKITVYRGTISSEDRGEIGDGLGHWYKTVTCSVIQQ